MSKNNITNVIRPISEKTKTEVPQLIDTNKYKPFKQNTIVDNIPKALLDYKQINMFDGSATTQT